MDKCATRLGTMSAFGASHRLLTPLPVRSRAEYGQCVARDPGSRFAARLGPDLA